MKVIEFGPAIRSRSVLNFGQSGDPASPHFFDQGPLYARRTFKDAWFSDADVKAHATRHYVVREGSPGARAARGRGASRASGR